jgi:Uma2 family endonuclease
MAYLEFEKTTPIRHNYINGAIYAMAGANEQHNLITGNIFLH